MFSHPASGSARTQETNPTPSVSVPQSSRSGMTTSIDSRVVSYYSTIHATRDVEAVASAVAHATWQIRRSNSNKLFRVLLGQAAGARPAVTLTDRKARTITGSFVVDSIIIMWENPEVAWERG